MFENNYCKATVLDIAKAFRPDGMLGTEVESIGIYILSERYKEYEKLVVPYWITVSLFLYILIFCLSFFACYFIFVSVPFVYACFI